VIAEVPVARACHRHPEAVEVAAVEDSPEAEAVVPVAAEAEAAEVVVEEVDVAAEAAAVAGDSL